MRLLRLLILVIIVIIVTKVIMALMLKVVIEDRWVRWIVLGRQGPPFGANKVKLH